MKIVENIVANREIAYHEEFLLLPKEFQESSAAEASEKNCMQEKVKVKVKGNNQIT